MVLVRICLWPMTGVLPAAEVILLSSWISNLFRISNFGFRMSDFLIGCGQRPR